MSTRASLAAVRWLTLAVAVGLNGCDLGTDPKEPERQGIVSNPVSSIAAASGIARAPGAAAATDVVYVSLPPDSIPDGQIAVIQNPRTGSSVATAMADGGFDPVGVEASVGDRIALDIQVTGGATLRSVWTVPERRKPRVVRTSPVATKRDVVLNAIMLIVFSEPVDAGTINPANVQLLHADAPVGGRPALSTDGLRVEFQPDQPLAPGTDYVLSVRRGVTDLTGDSLEVAVNAEFRTGGTTPSINGEIAFTSSLGIEVMAVDGSERRFVAPGWVREPAWSPDGAQLAFMRWYGDRSCSIHVVRVDGWEERPVTVRVGDRCDHSPAWSPDGREIALARREYSGSSLVGSLLAVVNVDGSGFRTLLDYQGSSMYHTEPSWSPDGRNLAFVGAAARPGAAHINLIRTDGTGEASRFVTDGVAPAWSPDGLLLAFSYGYAGVQVVNADGSGHRTVTLGAGWSAGPAWSPDGAYLVFASGNPSDLYLVNRDGTELRRLTATSGGEGDPVWRPDPRVSWRP